MKRLCFLLILFLVTVSGYSQQWELLTPFNTSDIGRNCSFIDEQTGYVVIQAAGDVLRTTDGGTVWERIWTPGISTNLYDVEMVSQDSVFTCGVSGEIFRTIDGGNSWNEMTTPTNEYLYALEFIDQNVGFSCGFNGVILKTVDGGTTWELKESNTINRLYDIEFVNENVGYACGWNSTVVKTVDAGETWEAIDTEAGVALFNCHFTSEETGYACGWSQTIVKTSDGGETWVNQHTGSNTLHFIEFKDENNGWAAGDWGNFVTTSNGGATWTSSSETGGYEIWGGQYLDDGFAVMVGKGCVFKSSNGGSNWDIIKNGVPNAKYNALYFHDDMNGSAAGSTGITGEGSNQSGIVKTENGGLTWDIQQQGFSGGWWDLHFWDQDHGTAIGGINFTSTDNGGDNWNSTTLPMDLTGVGTWWFDDNNGLVGGSGLFNGVCRTENGGSSYECEENMSGSDFFFLDDDFGFAVSDGGTENVWKTENGGETWETLPTGHYASKNSVFFLNENLGWIGGNNGVILKTIDGGENWDMYWAGTTVVGIHFYDENIGFCVDQGAYVYSTDDGGETWSFFLGDTFTMPPVMEGVFTENYLYIGCWSGDIYRCELGCGSILPAQITGSNEWCEGEVGIIAANSSAPISGFEWTLPEGWTTEEDDAVIEIIAGSQDGLIELTVTNACGLSAESMFEVFVTPVVNDIEEIIGSESLCQNVETFLSIETEINADEYDWSYPGSWSALEYGDSLLVIPDVAGWISIQTSNECSQSNELFQYYEVSESPDVDYQLMEEEFCPDVVINLSGATPEGGTYTVNGIESDFIDPSEVDFGWQEVVYTFTNEEGCSGLATDSIFLLNPNIESGLIIGDTVICQGEITEFVVDGFEGANTIEWVFPEDWMATFEENTLTVANPSSSGDIMAMANGFCGSSLSENLFINVQSIPSPPVIISADSIWCADQTGSIEFDVIEQSATSFSNPSGLDLEIVSDNQIEYSGEAGEYWFEIISENFCGSSQI